MTKYFAPLRIFVVGHILLLVVWLLMPAVGDAGDQLAAATAANASTFWGWTWVVSGLRFWVWLAFEAGILYVTARSLIGLKL